MHQLPNDYYNRILEAVLNDSALARMTDLLQKHTVLLGRPYSFHEHEYQIDICNEPPDDPQGAPARSFGREDC